MKKILFVVMLTMSSMLSFAGVIMTSSNERIEDVTITSETDSAIVYIQDGVEKSIAIEQVSAILYDNGTYKELVNESNKPSQDVTDNLGNVALIHLDKKTYDIDNIDKIDGIKEIQSITREQIIAAANALKLDTVYTLTSSEEDNT